MNSAPVPSVPAPAPRRRRLWPWILGLALAPFVVLGIAAASVLTLDRDAAALRRHVMAASGTEWSTKVQVSVGGLILGGLRTGLWFAPGDEVADARLALGALRHASVGVYERVGGALALSRQELLVSTDRAMQRRGWTRLVGVAEPKETVLIYVSDDADADGPLELCLAVVADKELVVVSTAVAPEALQTLIERHAGEDLRAQLRRHALLPPRA